MTNDLGIERGSIITLSLAHLSPETMVEIMEARGNISEGPSIAVRPDGFLMNSHYGTDDALEIDTNPGRYKALSDRYPDLVLIRALARGLKAEWVCLDSDGTLYPEILPVYDDNGINPPTGEGWSECLSEVGTSYWGYDVIVPSKETLMMIDAGQTPRLDAPAP